MIRRLQAYAQAGADVVFAPGVNDLDEVRRVVAEVERPVSVLASAGSPSVAELASVGVARISVGGAFAYAALGTVVDAAMEFRDSGTYDYLNIAARGAKAARAAFNR